jgi:hypothetical protein
VAGITVGGVALFLIIVTVGVFLIMKLYAPKPNNPESTKVTKSRSNQLSADPHGHAADHGFAIHADTVPMPASFLPANTGGDSAAGFVFRVLPTPLRETADAQAQPVIFDDSAPPDFPAAGDGEDGGSRAQPRPPTPTPLRPASLPASHSPPARRPPPPSIGRPAPIVAAGPPRWFPPADAGLTPPLPPWALSHIPSAGMPSPQAGLPPRDPGLDAPLPPWACAPGPWVLPRG